MAITLQQSMNAPAALVRIKAPVLIWWMVMYVTVRLAMMEVIVKMVSQIDPLLKEFHYAHEVDVPEIVFSKLNKVNVVSIFQYINFDYC